jgi:hypothetical protein
MKKRNKESFNSAFVNMIAADFQAREGTPRGSLAQKHAGKIALRYAYKARAIDRANRVKKFLIFSGVVGLIIYLATNWL